MRKIETRYSKQQRERKQKRNQLIVGFFIVFILLFSVFGYSFMSQGNSDNSLKNIEYNGNEFIQRNNYWILNNEDVQFAIQNNPKEIDNYSKYIQEDIKDINSYLNQPLYIYSQENSTSASYEIYSNLNSIALRIQPGCLENSSLECEEEWPIKNCDNNLIIFETGKTPARVYQEDRCVYIQGKNSEELIKITNKFLLNIFNLDR